MNEKIITTLACIYLIVEGQHGNVVDLEAVGHVAHSFAIGRVEMRQHDHFVSHLEQTLRQLEDVALDASHVRIVKVRHHAYRVPHFVCLLVCL